MAEVRVHGTLRVPGDKSISHRALILSALAPGPSRIRNILDAADVRSTAHALRVLGAAIPELSADFVIAGTGVLPRARDVVIDCGNSGTTARLMAGVVAGLRSSAAFHGDASLSRRPMRRVAEPLRAMGATVELPEHGGLPMRVAATTLESVDWTSPVATAQVKSAVLLAALLGGVRACFSEPQLSRDHTERMLEARGIALRRSGSALELEAGQRLRPADTRVPADPSSAAYFVALAALARAGALRLTDVCLNETRTGFLDAMLRMGADIALSDQRIEGGETVGTITVRPASLHGITVEAKDVPSMIDELPLLACVAARADGTTVVQGAAELRVKESDRIAAIVTTLRDLGGVAEERADGWQVVGSRTPLRGVVDPRGDHRIAMAFGVLAAVASSGMGGVGGGGSGGGRQPIVVTDRECVAVSYPQFWSDLERVVT